jgi:Zn-dependent protease with chaperone function
MAILHGKYAGWFRDLNFLRATAIGFLFVLMAWFGVNYILATGLHSYGFSQGGALFLALVLAFQLVVLAISRLRAL